jgi:hypothetical protein
MKMILNNKIYINQMNIEQNKIQLIFIYIL